jgi:hypothetical protein
VDEGDGGVPVGASPIGGPTTGGSVVVGTVVGPVVGNKVVEVVEVDGTACAPEGAGEARRSVTKATTQLTITPNARERARARPPRVGALSSRSGMGHCGNAASGRFPS